MSEIVSGGESSDPSLKTTEDGSRAVNPERMPSQAPLAHPSVAPPSNLPLPEVHVAIGLPGSGKTTYGAKWVMEDPQGRQRINYDLIRGDCHAKGFDPKAERAVQVKAMDLAKAALLAGRSLYIDNCNLTASQKDRWRNLAKDAGILDRYHEVPFTSTPVAECVGRDQGRSGRARVGRAVIERMALTAGLIDFSDATQYPKGRFIIVDVDGTLADCDWRRGLFLDPIRCLKCDYAAPSEDELAHRVCATCGTPLKKDWPRFLANVALDNPIPNIIELVQYLSLKAHVLIVSGRGIDPAGRPTEDWLRKYNVPCTHLFLRAAGDRRDDTVVKQDLLNLIKETLPLNRIKLVLDDRDSVVKMWRANGLTCLQVREGAF